jgi:predicted TIM-barrel fold metal-dependent hydrolase
MWEACSAHRWPVSFHVLTGGDEGDPTFGSGIAFVGMGQCMNRMQRTLNLLMFGGVFDRHPDLQIVSAENDAGWVAHYAYRMDQMYERHHNWLAAGIHIERTPGEYLASHVWYTFQKDPVAVETRVRVGVDRLMWASDYPHSDSTWPHSREVIERDFKGVPRHELAAIVGGNAATLYGLEI